MTAGEWRSQANCASVEPETFFPAGEGGPIYDAQVAVAKAVCAGCSVRAECLAEALVRIPFGIAGGLTAEERRGHRSRPIGTEPAAVLERGLRPGARRTEVEAAGRVLLTAGRSIPEVARRCGVTERTATRWAARTRALTPATGEGSRGGNRAPLRISLTHNTLTGTRTQEGHRA